MALRNWRLRRVLALSVLWIVVAIGVRVARSIAFARQAQARQPGSDFYVVLVHLPGGLWTLLGPPVLLLMVWVAVRHAYLAH